MHLFLESELKNNICILLSRQVIPTEEVCSSKLEIRIMIKVPLAIKHVQTNLESNYYVRCTRRRKGASNKPSTEGGPTVCSLVCSQATTQ